MGLQTLITLVNRMGYVARVSQIRIDGKFIWGASIQDPSQSYKIVGDTDEYYKRPADALASAIENMVKGGK